MTEIEKIQEAEAARAIKSLDLSFIDRKAMEVCFAMSTVIWRGTIDGELACIWGLVPPTLLSNQAYLWLYTTDLIKEHQFVFIRHSQLVMEEMLKVYPSIVGHAMVNNHKAIRWLKWLGAKFGQPIGNGLPFRIEKHG